MAGQLAEGLSSLRKGATLEVASHILSLAASLLVLPALLTLLAALARPHPLLGLAQSGGLALLAAAGVLALAGLALGLAALFGFIVPGIGKLAKWDRAFETPSKLAKWGYLAALILGILALAAAAAALAPLLAARAGAPAGPGALILRLIAGAFALLALAVLAAVAYLVGFAGLATALFELSSKTKVDGFKLAAILLILAQALALAAALPRGGALLAVASPILSLIGWIIVRDAAGKAAAVQPS